MICSHKCSYPQLQGYSSLLGNCKNIELYLVESGLLMVQLLSTKEPGFVLVQFLSTE